MADGILFGKFVKVSQETKTIKAKNEGDPDGKYYVIYLTNGIKTFEVTCGEKNDILAIPTMQWFMFGFDVDNRKIKVVSVTPIDKDNNAAPADKSPRSASK